MDDQTIKTTIQKYLMEEYLDSDEKTTFSEQTPLITSGLIDSISILQVVDFLEESFGFEFEPHEVDQTNLDSIETMLGFIKTKLNHN